MIKKTLYFGNPAYLSLHLGQLVVKLPEVEKNDMPKSLKANCNRTIPIEDIGVVVLDNKQITITTGVISALLENEVAIITCNDYRMPTGMLLPLMGNKVYNERFRQQIECSLPLRKHLWQQTVKTKIENQANCLRKNTSSSIKPLMVMAQKVKSGDTDNCEAQAAVYYWKNIFPEISDFTRDRNGDAPNNLLNYGYAILRSVVARSLVVSGLLPIYGIHHHNKYNAYCLADDIMEPYRPFVDDMVISIMKQHPNYQEISAGAKRSLLSIPTLDVVIDGRRSPLMVAVSTTTASLSKCFKGELRKIVYPEFI